MILDGHIHVREGGGDREAFVKRLHAAGIDGGIVISLPPAASSDTKGALSPSERIRDVLSWCEPSDDLYPFYWIDPLEKDAPGQASEAAGKGIAGFKIICDRFPPGDERALAVCAAAARAGLPVLFHSGILWDGKPSSPYNRPAAFEALLEVEGLRFCLAHMAWPWCDELIAVYGKFLNAVEKRPGPAAEMFVDTTPGTPPIYREEALTKLFTVGYDVIDSVFFGSDSNVNDYNVPWTLGWMARDRRILEDLGLDEKDLEKIFAGNVRRFVGVSSVRPEKKPPRTGKS